MAAFHNCNLEPAFPEPPHKSRSVRLRVSATASFLQAAYAYSYRLRTGDSFDCTGPFSPVTAAAHGALKSS